MRKFAQDDKEDDKARDPGVSLVRMHHLVPEESDEECHGSNDNDAGPAGHIAIDGVEELGADDDIDSGPAETGDDIEDSNFGGSDTGNANVWKILTNLHTIPPKEETRQHNLSEPKPWAKSREETDGGDG